jgi:hypothetical protein
MKKQPNPEMVDEENPQWTRGDFKRAIPFAALCRHVGCNLLK